MCIALCTTVAHNTAQNRPDNFSSYPSSLLRWCLFEGRGGAQSLVTVQPTDMAMWQSWDWLSVSNYVIL